MKKNVLLGVVLVASVLVFGGAQAATIDVTAITTGISDAGVAVLAVISALLALSTSIFGMSKVYGFVKRKAGA